MMKKRYPAGKRIRAVRNAAANGRHNQARSDFEAAWKNIPGYNAILTYSRK